MPHKDSDNNPDLPRESAHDTVWRPYMFFNYYRIVLAAFFVLTQFLENTLPILGNHDSVLYVSVSTSYLLLAIISSFLIHFRWIGFLTLTYSLVLIDILALTLLMHASGGLDSGLGMLIIVAIAGNSLVIAGRTASLFAAIAALAILAQQSYSYLTGTMETNYTQAGILGISLFVTAILAHGISRRIRETEELAEQRGIDLANLAQLNEHVIKRMQSGIVVVDANDRIRLMNESAWHMLGLPTVKNKYGNETLPVISKELYEAYKAWASQDTKESKILHSRISAIDILPTFTRLGRDAYSGTLIFLEDVTRLKQQAQQMKLASLGRLTASIAHEIRNPLGAISHAEQLLAESSHLEKADKRLTEIIHTNSERVNGIIENVLKLSRKGNYLPEKINLKDWLDAFINELAIGLNIQQETVSCSITPVDIQVYFDNTQLHQILWNLCQNGLHYSKDHPANPKLELIGGLDKETNKVRLDVIDHGPGIDLDTAQHIFEPFFTTDAKGSGLGLFIARELCATNQARLSYLPVPSGGSCFRIEFSSNDYTTNQAMGVST